MCVRCGLTRDFFSDDLDELTLPRALDDLGQAETTHVEARGVCRECAAADNETRPETSEEDKTGFTSQT